MLIFSQSDVNSYLTQVIKMVATALNVAPNIKDIKTKDAIIGANLEFFDIAYRNWYQFHVTIDADNITALNPAQTTELRTLISLRDSTRSTLVSSIQTPSSTLPAPSYNEAALEERLGLLYESMQP